MNERISMSIANNESSGEMNEQLVVFVLQWPLVRVRKNTDVTDKNGYTHHSSQDFPVTWVIPAKEQQPGSTRAYRKWKIKISSLYCDLSKGRSFFIRLFLTSQSFLLHKQKVLIPEKLSCWVRLILPLLFPYSHFCLSSQVTMPSSLTQQLLWMSLLQLWQLESNLCIQLPLL